MSVRLPMVPAASPHPAREVGPAPRAAPPPPGDRANLAYVAFLAFVVSIYASTAQLVPALAPLAPGQTLIGLAAVGLAWSCLLGRRPFRLGLTGGGRFLYLFFLMLAISPAWSLWPRASVDAVSEALKYVVAFTVAANVLDTRARVRTAVATVALATLFPAIGAFYSELSGEYIVEGTRAAWLGAFGNPNYLAFHLAVSAPLALALRDSVAADAPDRHLRRLFWLLVVATYAAAVFLTESRGGTIGLGAVLLLWTARGLVQGRAALGAAAAFVVAIVMTPGSPLDRAATQATLQGEVDASAQGRLDAWRTAERIVLDRPGLGVGAGAFVLGYDQHAPGDAGPARAAHNSFLMVAAELGLPAALLFAAALAGSFLTLGKRARDPLAPGHGAVERGLQTALFGFFICSLTGSYAFSWPLYFVMGIGAALGLVREDRATA